MISLLILAALLLICHWLADFSPLSTAEMLAAKKHGSPLFPIFSHAWVHSMLMIIAIYLWYIICLHGSLTLMPKYTINGVTFAVFSELFTHFLIDVGKGRLAYYCPSTADMKLKRFWVVFGLDQLLHQLVILVITGVCGYATHLWKP